MRKIIYKRKIINKKGFTLVELLAVIVVLAIVMGLAVVGISTVLENTRKSAFNSDANSYIQGARSLVNADLASATLGLTTMYSPKCTGSGETIYIPVAAIKLDSGGKSPYGNWYYIGSTTAKQTSAASIKTDASAISQSNKTGSIPGTAVQASYVKVTSSVTNGDCKMTYSIFLTDGVKKIAETVETNLNASLVTNA